MLQLLHTSIPEGGTHVHTYGVMGGPLTPKFDRATGPFLTIDRRH